MHKANKRHLSSEGSAPDGACSPANGAWFAEVKVITFVQEHLDELSASYGVTRLPRRFPCNWVVEKRVARISIAELHPPDEVNAGLYDKD